MRSCPVLRGADRMDLETRIAGARSRCRATPRPMRRRERSRPDRKADMEAYVAFVTSESRGIRMKSGRGHPKEQEAYRLARDVLLSRRHARLRMRDGHSEDAKRIRRGYRRTSRRRRARRKPTRRGRPTACHRASCAVPVAPLRLLSPARFPELVFASDASIALTMFLARQRQRRRVRRARESSADGAQVMPPAQPCLRARRRGRRSGDPRRWRDGTERRGGLRQGHCRLKASSGSRDRRSSTASCRTTCREHAANTPARRCRRT